MNFPFILQTRAVSLDSQCHSITYPSPDNNPDLARENNQNPVSLSPLELSRCVAFSRLGLSNIPSFQRLFRSSFNTFRSNSDLQNIHNPWRLPPSVLRQFSNDLNSYRRANPLAATNQILNYIYRYPQDVLHIQVDSVSSTDAYLEQTASEILALSDRHTKCTGIAYIYAALLQSAGFQPQFAWRSQNANHEVIEHLYVVARVQQQRIEFDPLFNGTQMPLRNLANVKVLSPREVLAWHYFGLVGDLGHQIESSSSNQNVDSLIMRRRQLLQIAYTLDPNNPYIRYSHQVNSGR